MPTLSGAEFISLCALPNDRKAPRISRRPMRIEQSRPADIDLRDLIRASRGGGPRGGTFDAEVDECYAASEPPRRVRKQPQHDDHQQDAAERLPRDFEDCALRARDPPARAQRHLRRECPDQNIHPAINGKSDRRDLRHAGILYDAAGRGREVAAHTRSHVHVGRAESGKDHARSYPDCHGLTRRVYIPLWTLYAAGSSIPGSGRSGSR